MTSDYHKEPWKHPACWKAHMVRRTLGLVAGAEVSIAACQCGWSAHARIDQNGARAAIAQTEAVNDHWRGVIADAEAVPA